MQTRFPFRYGIANLTDLPHLIVQVQAEVNGNVCRGVAADGLAPKWFTKNSDTSFEEDDLPNMLGSIFHAAERAVEVGTHPSIFDWWWETYQSQAAWGTQHDVAPLLSGFGCSLLERAAIDAFCRSLQIPLATALREDMMGIDLGRMRGNLNGLGVHEILPSVPNRKLSVRHTVGLGDPLTENDITEASRLNDGLPHSLIDNIHSYGLRYLKIKLSGKIEQDCQRMTTLAELLASEVDGVIRFTLDGNEQFRTFGDFRNAWDQLRAIPVVADMLDRGLIFVEQPLHRDVALRESVGDELRAWPDAPPMIIDESDGDFDSFPRAIQLGYRGTSHKNCKGIFKSLATAGTIRQHHDRGRPLVFSAEDLGNVGPIALLQDLAVVASLGIQHAERNGHHYFAGLNMFPDAIQESVLKNHPDLYHRHQTGFAALTVADGEVDLASVNLAPFGLGPLPDLSRFPRWNG